MINEAKRPSYNDKITNSNNTSKITWNIIRVDLGKNSLKDKNCNIVKFDPCAFNNYL
jgi:hypothetical protein